MKIGDRVKLILKSDIEEATEDIEEV